MWAARLTLEAMGESALRTSLGAGLNPAPPPSLGIFVHRQHVGTTFSQPKHQHSARLISASPPKVNRKWLWSYDYAGLYGIKFVFYFINMQAR